MDFHRIGEAITRPVKRFGKTVKKLLDPSVIARIWAAIKKEAVIGPVLHEESLGALARMKATDPGLEGLLERAYGYAVLPRVGKAQAVLGGAFGVGEVFKHEDHVIGYAAIAQLTLGVQLGGQTFSELVVFESEADFERFKHSRFGFAANASAVAVKAGASKGRAPSKTRVFVQSEGGLGIEAAIGEQTFIYMPAALGRIRGLREFVARHLHHEQ